MTGCEGNIRRVITNPLGVTSDGAIFNFRSVYLFQTHSKHHKKHELLLAVALWSCCSVSRQSRKFSRDVRVPGRIPQVEG